MIKQEKMLILDNKTNAEDTIELVLENDHISRYASPGQFIHIQVEGFTLRRPISIADVDKDNKKVTILFKTFGDGTRKLASYQPGQHINVIGPLGNGFDLCDIHNEKVLRSEEHTSELQSR